LWVLYENPVVVKENIACLFGYPIEKESA